MPGAKVWDPTPAGGSLSTARGEQNPSADGASLSSTEVAAVRALVSGDRTADAISRDITASDNGKTLAPTGALTYTIPAGLSPAPSFTVDCPASGTITIASSGGATLNGAGTSLTRTRASNPVGFVVLAHVETDSYGVSGA
jgi:hypothetical protein